jgi:two-component system, chemotaxis family, protein-glutamate methylesterase/glutaminase
LFESAADVLGSRVVGILLSGASADGALGLKAIVQAGGLALIQAPRESASSAMPEAAIAMCPKARVLSLEGIRDCLRRLGDGGTSREQGTP